MSNRRLFAALRSTKFPRRYLKVANYIVQTGAQFSGPAHVDPSQYHYFVQEYHWPTRATNTAQEPRNAQGTAYGVQNEPRVAGLLNK
jgi:hypothetical protein